MGNIQLFWIIKYRRISHYPRIFKYRKGIFKYRLGIMKYRHRYKNGFSILDIKKESESVHHGLTHSKKINIKLNDN